MNRAPQDRTRVGSICGLGTNVLNLAGPKIFKCRQDFSDERPKIFYAIRPSPNDHNTKEKIANLLLALEIAVHREKCVDLALRPLEKLAVLDARPT